VPRQLDKTAVLSRSLIGYPSEHGATIARTTRPQPAVSTRTAWSTTPFYTDRQFCFHASPGAALPVIAAAAAAVCGTERTISRAKWTVGGRGREREKNRMTYTREKK